ncbi:MAG TPA: T9SS type A sorting domain-containing protein, partial [Ignavibacteria bacterium]|nr:T9SS type A sorting domain-containing protein [Ignavibacteria bacterium]HMR00190.1 T9SS type A sorting domain-containing protein [Ignavibacteria bacterium]
AFSYAGFGPTNIYANQEGLVTGIQSNGTEIPNAYSLQQNYPNPFNPVTNIKFNLPKSGYVKLVVFDIMGREVATMLNENMNAGSYTADFDASRLSSGIYFYKLVTADFTDTKKMMLVK